MQWVASTLHTTSERGVSSITTADTHTSAGQESVPGNRTRSLLACSAVPQRTAPLRDVICLLLRREAAATNIASCLSNQYSDNLFIVNLQYIFPSTKQYYGIFT